MMSTGSLSLTRTQGESAHAGAVALGGLLHPSTKRGAQGNARDAATFRDATIDTELGPQKVNMTRPPKDVSDHELLQRFQQGDEDGYVELYLRRQAEVFTFALRLAAGDRDFASDIFQETFIKVYRKAHTFREVTGQDGTESANVLGWLYTIVRTTYLNHVRRRTTVGLDDSHDNLQSTDRSLSPEYREEQSTLKERVEAAILSLPIEIREPFILREFDGMSYQEISVQLNLTLGGVRQRIYRAKLAMREQLRDLVQDENEIMTNE
jgi:RNA polymerase sigma-70 factor, ECF subfamily